MYIGRKKSGQNPQNIYELHEIKRFLEVMELE